MVSTNSEGVFLSLLLGRLFFSGDRLAGGELDAMFSSLDLQVLLGHLTGQWIALYFAFDLFTYLGMFQTPFPSPLKFVAYILFNMVCLDTGECVVRRKNM